MQDILLLAGGDAILGSRGVAASWVGTKWWLSNEVVAASSWLANKVGAADDDVGSEGVTGAVDTAGGWADESARLWITRIMLEG